MEVSFKLDIFTIQNYEWVAIRSITTFADFNHNDSRYKSINTLTVKHVIDILSAKMCIIYIDLHYCLCFIMQVFYHIHLK